MPTENAKSIAEEARFAARTALIQAASHARIRAYYKNLLGSLLVDRFVTIRDLDRQTRS